MSQISPQADRQTASPTQASAQDTVQAAESALNQLSANPATVTQRKALNESLWDAANALRNHLDGWDFKAYTFAILLYRFLSDHFVFQVNQIERKYDAEFDYAALIDEDLPEEEAAAQEAADQAQYTNLFGYYLRPDQLFQFVYNKYQNSNDLPQVLKDVFKQITNTATANQAAQTVFQDLFKDVDFFATKLGKDNKARATVLTKLMSAIDKVELGIVNEQDIDAFGDAYEFLMNMYASQAGKSGGEYFTPQEVSDLVTKIATKTDAKGGAAKFSSVYDPCCGSGSMLLRAARNLVGDTPEETKDLRHEVEFYGQELNETTYNLCRMNMILHAVDYEKIHLHRDNTLFHPAPEHEGKKFDVIISNPPYSTKLSDDEVNKLLADSRFLGLKVPKKAADYAFILHALYCLADTGTAALVIPDGSLSRREEVHIRQYLVENNFVDAVVSLPGGIFFGTGTKTSILVLKKQRVHKDVYFIDASDYVEKVKDKGQNSQQTVVLTQEGVEKVMEFLADRKTVEELTALVSAEKLAKFDYTLLANYYVKKRAPSVDIDLAQVYAEYKAADAKVREHEKHVVSLIEEWLANGHVEVKTSAQVGE